MDEIILHDMVKSSKLPFFTEFVENQQINPCY